MTERKNRKKLDTSDLIIRGFGYVFITIITVISLMPFLLIIGTSFSDETVVRVSGFTMIPNSLHWKHISFCF